jgi:hypothetical protein
MIHTKCKSSEHKMCSWTALPLAMAWAIGHNLGKISKLEVD